MTRRGRHLAWKGASGGGRLARPVRQRRTVPSHMSLQRAARAGGRDAHLHWGILHAALLSVLLLAACDALPGKPTEAERPLRPAQVVDFNTLYGTNCAGCHGDNGTLGAARPLNDAIYLRWSASNACDRSRPTACRTV